MAKISDRMAKVRRAIVDWRQGKALSVHDVAGRVAEHGLSSARIQEIETGRGEPMRVEELLNLADALELHPATLLEGDS